MDPSLKPEEVELPITDLRAAGGGVVTAAPLQLWSQADHDLAAALSSCLKQDLKRSVAACLWAGFRSVLRLESHLPLGSSWTFFYPFSLSFFQFVVAAVANRPAKPR